MSGPLPKPASQRRRRNRASTARQLRAVDPADVQIPELPRRRGSDGRFVGWRAETLGWWDRVWTSPMAPEFVEADIDGLFILAVLVDDFWRNPDPDLAKEVRLHRSLYGLEPISRRRLQWEINRGEEAEAATRERRQPKPVTDPAADPRANTG